MLIENYEKELKDIKVVGYKNNFVLELRKYNGIKIFYL